MLKKKKGAIQLGIEMPSFLALNVINSNILINSNCAKKDMTYAKAFWVMSFSSVLLFCLTYLAEVDADAAVQVA